MKTWVCSVVLLIAAPAIVAAGVVYSQPPKPSGVLYKSAWYPPDGLNGDSFTYDSFTLASTTAITEVRWKGGYANWQMPNGSSPVYDFEVSICGHVSTANQPDVSHPPLVTYRTGDNAQETSAGSIGGVPMYDYRFVLPSPFQALAGQTYWLRIVASQNLTPIYWPPDWGLAGATGGNGSHFLAYYAEGYSYSFRTDDLAFSILTFDGASVTIDASVSPAGGGTVSGAGVYPVGSTASLTATPASGFGFASWTENGTQVSAKPTYTFTANASRTLVANFVPAFTINVAVAPTYGGSVSGGGVYNSGSSVQVIATPKPGFVFVNWTWFGTEASTNATYSFSADSDMDLVANFVPDPMTAVFDFDTGYPTLGLGSGLPFSQSSGIASADFSSPGGSNWFVTTDAQMFWKLSQFHDKYLNQSNVYRQSLDIHFGQMMTAISFTFATGDLHQQEDPTTLRLQAYQGSTANGPVGTTTAAGAYLGDTFPMGTLTFSSAVPFDVVRIDIPYQPTGATTFLLDNISVTLAPIEVLTIADVLAYPDGMKIRLTSPKAATVASSAFASGDIYIEEPDRASAVRLAGAAGVAEGDRIKLTATLGTDPDGDRFLTLDSLEGKTPGSNLTPLGMSNQTAGDWLVRGLLVRAWGKVLAVAPDQAYLTIEDGCAVNPGAGVRVSLEAVTKPVSPGDYLLVTGVATAAGIRPRSDADVLPQ